MTRLNSVFSLFANFHVSGYSLALHIHLEQFKPALLTHHPFARSLAPPGVALKYLGGAVA